MKTEKKTAATFNKSEYDREYIKQHVYKLTLYLHREKDADIINALEQKGSKSAFIKGLIRNYIRNQ